jgi:hypothetical protein
VGDGGVFVAEQKNTQGRGGGQERCIHLSTLCMNGSHCLVQRRSSRPCSAALKNIPDLFQEYSSVGPVVWKKDPPCSRNILAKVLQGGGLFLWFVCV